MDYKSRNRGYSNSGYKQDSVTDPSGNFSFGIENDLYHHYGRSDNFSSEPVQAMDYYARFVPYESSSHFVSHELPDVNCEYEMNTLFDDTSNYRNENYKWENQKFKNAVPKYVEELWSRNEETFVENSLPYSKYGKGSKYSNNQISEMISQQKQNKNHYENRSKPSLHNAYTHFDKKDKINYKNVPENSYQFWNKHHFENQIEPSFISSYNQDKKIPYQQQSSFFTDSFYNQDRPNDKENNKQIPNFSNKIHPNITNRNIYKHNEYNAEEILSEPGPSREFPILDIKQTVVTQNQVKQNWINDIRKRNSNKSWNVEESQENSVELQTIEERNKSSKGETQELLFANKPFQTMRDARRIAEQLGMHSDIHNWEDELDEAEIEIDKYQERLRKCWCKFCWSTDKHSHAIEILERKQQYGDSNKNYSTRIKLDQGQKKMKEKFREFWNFVQAPFLLWNHDMKHIEGHYGTGIVSFFLFLRWMIYLNLLMTILAMGVIIVPEILFTIKEMYFWNKTDPAVFYLENYIKYKESSYEISTFTLQNTFFNLDNTSTDVFDTVLECSYNYTETILGYNSTLLDAFQHVLQGTGFMELTPMFIGWYKPGIMWKFKSRYELSEGYIFVTISYFLLCLIMMVSYTKKSLRETVLKKENQLQKYCNMIFTSWDFSIEDKKLAEMKHNYIYLKFKVHLAENRRLKEISNWSTLKKISITILRIIVNIIVVILLGGSSFLIYVDIMVSLEDETEDSQQEGFYSFFAEYRTSLIITAINIILPIVFNFLSSLENYSESFRIKISLIRCVFTRLASIAVLIVSLHSQISCTSRNECGEGIDKCQTPKCWETYVGQQIYKLSILDFIVVLITTFLVGFPRKLLVTKVKCKLFQLIGREEFDIPQNVLGLVYSQTLCWLGVFYCPFLPLLSVIKYFIYYYVKKFSLVINCGQSKESYRASRSNIFFILVLMMSYLIGLFPLLYSITELETSKGCSPFRYHKSAWDTMVHFIDKFPKWVNVAVGIIGSAGFGVPVFVILSLLLYYYLTLSATYSQLSEIMKDHLQMESRDKNFLLRKFMFILHHPQK